MRPTRVSTRLAAGSLVLALPLAAAAGCGAAKKRTIKQELQAAQQNLLDSDATSITLRVGDAKGNLAKEAATSGDISVAHAKDLLTSSVTFTFDGKSASAIKGVDAKASESELKDALSDVHLAIAVKSSGGTLGEIRLVDSTLFARIDVSAIDKVVGEASEADFQSGFDDFIDGAPDEYQSALNDVKAGKWLKLPLSGYVDKVQDALKSLPSADPSTEDLSRTGKDLFTAVKPYIKVTDANDDSSNRVLDVTVDARPAAKAALRVLKAVKGLPFGQAFDEVSDADIDDNLADGKAHGTLTLSDGHLKQVTVDIESIRKLDPNADTDLDLSGGDVVLDVDDSADQVKAPSSNVSSTDVKALLEDLVGSFFGGVDSASATVDSIEGGTGSVSVGG